MMTSPTYRPRHLLSAWSVSCCIHAIVLVSAVALFHDLPQLQPAVYRMEFLLTDPKSVADAATSHEATTVTEHSSPTAPSRSRATITPSRHIIEQQPPTENSIVQPVVNPVTPAAVEQREMSPSATASDSTPVASPTPSDRHVDTLPPVIEPPGPAPMNISQAIKPSFMTASPQVATSLTAEPSNKHIQDNVAHPSPPAPESSLSASEGANSPSPDSAISQPTGQSSVTTSQTASQTTDASSPPSQMDSGSPTATPQRTLVMNHPAIARTIPSRPDYGWLKDLLKRRIMSLQAYPRLARMQGWEGIVVVRATIKNDGSLLNVVVTESSGYAALDEDALKLMQRVCPIRLQHDLGQSHIEVLVPVHYRLE